MVCPGNVCMATLIKETIIMMMIIIIIIIIITQCNKQDT